MHNKEPICVGNSPFYGIGPEGKIHIASLRDNYVVIVLKFATAIAAGVWIPILFSFRKDIIRHLRIS